MKPKQAIAIFALFLATFISASGFFFVKKGIATLAPANLIFWRYLIASSLLSLLTFRHIQRNILKPGIFLGALLFGNVLFQYFGLETLPASTTSFVMGLAVVLVPLFARSFNMRTWSAVGVALLGIGVISLHSGFSIGLAWIFLGTICFSLYIILVGNYANTYNLLTLIAIQCAVICILSGILAWSQNSLSLPNEPKIWVYISVLAIVNSVIGIFLQFYAQKHLTHTTTAIIVSCEPIFATLVAVVLLSEHLTWNFYLGSILMFIAIVISEIKLVKPRAPEC
ncbi:MAG TPA: DMT family transporter [Rhabdochlamydiaceae bacterium]|jgi:drug/metabolite transporter (DMT)-like permease